MPYAKMFIEKQCEIANIDFNKIDFKSKDWFNEHTWTSENESEFKKWAIEYLKNNIKARRELCAIPSIKSNKALEKWFSLWNLMYGFKIIK